jgi:hypothetical protein
MNAQPTPSDQYEYQVGGCLPVDSPIYVRRQADEALYVALQAKEFCYVLNSRQMGKSSLRVQTMYHLQATGVYCVSVDLSEIGSRNVTVDQWYAGITYTLNVQFQIAELSRFKAWWNERLFLSPVQRLGCWLEEELLTKLNQPIVIFIDEIDSLLSLNFATDDFFALIRACYQKRVDCPAYQTITFVLLGVATPSNLVQDKSRTPFNIGQAISLTGFQFSEATPLISGLQNHAQDPHAVLKEILHWTEGQPFLTQKLCKLIQSSPYVIPVGNEATWVQQLVQSRIVQNWETQDEPPHLKTIRDRLLKNEQWTNRLLECYEKLLLCEKLPADESFEQMELRLSGLVVEHAGELRVYNRIYASIFDLDWVDTALENQRPYAQALMAWMLSDRQDPTHLLRGDELLDAQTWAADRSLSDQDYRFLAASLTSEKQATHHAETEAAVLENSRKQANRIVTIALGVVLAVLLVSGIVIAIRG